MDRDRQNQPQGQAAGEPRRRDVVLMALLGIAVLAVLAFSGELSAPAFLAGALALAALGVVYFLIAASGSDPSPMPQIAPVRHEAVPQTSEILVERLPIPVLLIGPGGRIERANPAARAFLGLGAERGLLSTVLRQPRVLEAVSVALRGERGATVEYSTVAPLESHVRAFIEPIRLDVTGPMPFRAMMVLADDTSSKRAERMRADFLANASHELRTPLASLSGFIETLNGPARDDEEARERFLGIMQVQTDRMRRLINDLLSLSRVEMNEHVPPTGDVDLSLLVQEVVESLSPVALRRSIKLSIGQCDTKTVVRGDRDQLFEVVENLLGNAIKYSSDEAEVCVCVYHDRTRDSAEQAHERLTPDSGRLTLTSPVLDADQRYGVVRVRDAGAGIERRFLPRLAERFFRVDGQKSGPRSGTGLGLAIVKHIVNRHRGGFSVESAPGIGTVFSVFFPVSDSGAEANSTVESKVATSTDA